VAVKAIPDAKATVPSAPTGEATSPPVQQEPALPVLDLREFDGCADPAARARFVEQLRETCHKVGFFYLIGHGIDDGLHQQVQAATRAFFELPDADRVAIAMANSPHFRGYTPLGGELTNGRADLREEIDLGPERPAPTLTAGDPPWKRLLGPNQWPARLPAFRTTMLAWHDQMDAVGHRLLRAIAAGLGLPEDRFDAWVDPDPEATIKAIRYPPPRTGDTNQGVGTHRDFGLLTFVLQDTVGGLQVERGGDFVDVVPLPGALVVNLGEMLQLATHGYLKATVHRVLSPPAGVQRFSVIYFFNPRLDASLAPVELPAELAAHAPGGNSGDPRNPILATYGENILKVRLRAHADVAGRHHRDLLT
jgi:isopenicillin N synthase-like dioxygenase